MPGPAGVLILADLAHQGAGPWLTTGVKRRPQQELTPTEKTLETGGTGLAPHVRYERPYPVLAPAAPLTEAVTPTAVPISPDCTG